QLPTCPQPRPQTQMPPHRQYRQASLPWLPHTSHPSHPSPKHHASPRSSRSNVMVWRGSRRGNALKGPAASRLPPGAPPREGRTLILTGYGAGLRVERDALIVTEGRTHHPQTPLVHTLYRGVHAVSRIICLDPKGSVSFPAVSWCAEQGITLLLLDHA